MRMMLVFALAVALAGGAWAQTCDVDIQDASFGAVDITSGGSFDTYGQITANCAGTPGATIRICPNFGEGSGGATADGSLRWLLASDGRLGFTIAAPEPSSLEVTLDAGGRGSVNRSMRYSSAPAQSFLPPGHYVSMFAGADAWVNYGYGSAGDCEAIGRQNLNPVQASFTVSASIKPACTVTATDADFGRQSLLDGAVDTVNRIEVRCSAGVSYHIGLDGGRADAADPASRVLRKGPHELRYGIFTDAARTTGWGNRIGENTVSGMGTGQVQSHTGYFRVAPQNAPAAGVYRDTIVVTVSY